MTEHENTGPTSAGAAVARVAAARRVEWGDFQTPDELARDVVACLAHDGVKPASIVEPTCGRGALIAAGRDGWSSVRAVRGFELQPAHFEAARERLATTSPGLDQRLEHADFFTVDWHAVLQSLPEPILILGNPPWVTNAEVGRVAGSNLPTKSNTARARGLAARTGSSNFDISESMLCTLLEASIGRDLELAVLCKTAVARKVLAHAWKHGWPIAGARLHAIDATRWFGATVDACLLRVRTSAHASESDCEQRSSLEAADGTWFGWRDGGLVADVAAYERWKHLSGASLVKWRSGVKHDASSIMELGVRADDAGNRLVNGLGEVVDVEDEHVFPMLKSSELTATRAVAPTRRMLVPQRAMGQDTSTLAASAPRTWAYLTRHAARLDGRKSSIYRGRARFAVFGVGAYAFAPWKVAISGFYKRLAFTLVPPFEGRPVVLDDTAYFVPCATREQAECLASLVSSEPAREFFGAFVFWDAKRPITAELLNRLDLTALARELGRDTEWNAHVERANVT